MDTNSGVLRSDVVPLAGTWIETVGLCASIIKPIVVPLAGTWIETGNYIIIIFLNNRRSPCGNVD